MGSYQTLDAVRPVMQRGPVAMPVVNRDLVRPRGPAAKTWSKGKAIPDHVRREIVARRERGEGYKKICAEVGVAMGTVSRFTRHVPKPPGGWPNCWASGGRVRPERNLAFAQRLRRAGFSLDEVGQELGCSATTVARLLNPGRKHKSGRAPISDIIRNAAIVSGFTRRELRKVDGVSRKNDGLAKARHIAFWLLRTYRPALSFPVIGKSLGGFDHTSILYGFAQANRVAVALGVGAETGPRIAARLLWEADWRKVGK